MSEDYEKKRYQTKKRMIISGLGAYATHKKESFSQWRANTILAKEYLKTKQMVFIEFKI